MPKQKINTHHDSHGIYFEAAPVQWNWFSTSPGADVAEVSAFILELLEWNCWCLGMSRACWRQDTLGVAAHVMPQDAYMRLAQGLFGFLNDWMMSLLADDAVPAYNMYGLFRLADDLASIQALADVTPPTGLAVHTTHTIHMLMTSGLSQSVYHDITRCSSTCGSDCSPAADCMFLLSQQLKLLRHCQMQYNSSIGHNDAASDWHFVQTDGVCCANIKKYGACSSATLHICQIWTTVRVLHADQDGRGGADLYIAGDRQAGGGA